MLQSCLTHAHRARAAAAVVHGSPAAHATLATLDGKPQKRELVSSPEPHISGRPADNSSVGRNYRLRMEKWLNFGRKWPKIAILPNFGIGRHRKSSVGLPLALMPLQTQKHPEYSGPALGPKMASENKRNFSEEETRRMRDAEVGIGVRVFEEFQITA